MENNMLEKISDAINKKIASDKTISSDQLDAYLQQIFEYIRCADSVTLPYSFCLLRDKLFKKWEYGAIEKLDAKASFLLGALWSGAILSELAEAERLKRPNLEALAKQNLKYYKILKVIQARPGIMHKELAKISELSTSELSQWMTKIQFENLFSFSRAGREKYYYIEKKGEDIIPEMERLHSAESKDLNDGETIQEPNEVVSISSMIKFKPTHLISFENLINENSDFKLENLQNFNLGKEEEKWTMKKEFYEIMTSNCEDF